VLAIVLQIRLGLRPLERLRQALADVRTGRSERVPSRQPQEIRPVVDELMSSTRCLTRMTPISNARVVTLLIWLTD